MRRNLSLSLSLFLFLSLSSFSQHKKTPPLTERHAVADGRRGVRVPGLDGRRQQRQPDFVKGALQRRLLLLPRGECRLADGDPDDRLQEQLELVEPGHAQGGEHRGDGAAGLAAEGGRAGDGGAQDVSVFFFVKSKRSRMRERESFPPF